MKSESSRAIDRSRLELGECERTMGHSICGARATVAWMCHANTIERLLCPRHAAESWEWCVEQGTMGSFYRVVPVADVEP